MLPYFGCAHETHHTAPSCLLFISIASAGGDDGRLTLSVSLSTYVSLHQLQRSSLSCLTNKSQVDDHSSLKLHHAKKPLVYIVAVKRRAAVEADIEAVNGSLTIMSS
jgi:hypothetical protein